MRCLRWIRTRWDVLLSVTCLVALFAGAGFTWGLLAGAGRVFPRHRLGPFLQTSDAIREKCRYLVYRILPSPKHKRYSNLWWRTTEAESGVVLSEPGRCQPGYTLFSDCTPAAYLIDLQGRVIHTWRKPFSEVWPDPPHIIDTVPDDYIYWRKVHLLPHGDLLAIYEGMYQSPYGGGLVKLDRNSRLIWKADINAHHDLDVAPDGRIFVLTHRYAKEGPRIDDYVTVLAPSGEILEHIPLRDAFAQSSYANMLPRIPRGDYLHSNTIEILTEDLARDFPWFEPGDMLLAHNTLSAVTVLGGKTHVIRWALSGLAHKVHDPDFLRGGAIVFLDNWGHRETGEQRSRIIEYDLHTAQPRWVYGEAETFYTWNRGSQQKLANGNYLITESAAGTIFEVTRDHEVVWKYVSTNFDGTSIGIVNWAERHSGPSLAFLDEKDHPVDSGAAE